MITEAPAIVRRKPASPLEPLIASVAEELAEVEALLRDRGGGPLPIVPQVTGYLFEAGGKRLRPLLALLAARAGGVERRGALRVATVSELIHTASLLHDDVVDETTSRRGRAAAPRVFGNCTCVLLGDALLASSLLLLAELDDHGPLASLARCVRRMALGELQQLSRATALDSRLIGYLRVIEGKTSALFAWCACVGELSPAPLRSPLARFGRRLGVAFQIADDILDLDGDPALTGKEVGADLREGKLTLPVHYACCLQPELRLRIEELLDPERSAQLADRLPAVIAEVRRSGGIAAARRTAELVLERAHRALGELPASSWRQALHQLADSVVRRVA